MEKQPDVQQTIVEAAGRMADTFHKFEISVREAGERFAEYARAIEPFDNQNLNDHE